MKDGSKRIYIMKRENFEIKLPECGDAEFNIADYGAVAGGKVSNTQAFAEAIAAAAAQGGKVVVPKGIWLTGPIELRSGVELHLQDNAVILFSKNKEEYPLIVTDYEGIRRIRAVSPISANGQTNIAITGNGVIDGNGHLWRPVKQFKTTERQWKELLSKSSYVIDSNEGGVWVPEESIYKGRFRGEIFPDDYDTEEEALREAAAYYDFYRPVLMSLKHCERVLIEGVILRNSAAWMLHPYFCEEVTIRNITLVNPAYAQNGDGIDVDSCKNVEIHHSTFMTGDDAICVKAGKDRQARTLKKSSENIYIHDCTVLHSPSGFVIGSEMSRGVKNVLVEDCTCIDSKVGICFKSAIGRGGVVENIHIRRMNMVDLKVKAVSITMDYVHNIMDYHDPVVQSDDPEDIPEFRNVFIEDCRCTGGEWGVTIHGLAGRPDTVHDITIKNCDFAFGDKLDLKDCNKIEIYE